MRSLPFALCLVLHGGMLLGTEASPNARTAALFEKVASSYMQGDFNSALRHLAHLLPQLHPSTDEMSKVQRA